MHANVNCLDNIASLSVAETEMRLLFNQDLHLTHANLREKCIKQTVVRTRLNASVRLFTRSHFQWRFCLPGLWRRASTCLTRTAGRVWVLPGRRRSQSVSFSCSRPTRKKTPSSRTFSSLTFLSLRVTWTNSKVPLSRLDMICGLLSLCAICCVSLLRCVCLWLSVCLKAMILSRRSADPSQRALAYSRMVDGLNEFRWVCGDMSLDAAHQVFCYLHPLKVQPRFTGHLIRSCDMRHIVSNLNERLWRRYWKFPAAALSTMTFATIHTITPVSCSGQPEA